MNDTKAANKAPAYTEVARGAGSLVLTCPHCKQSPAKERYPLCSWCGLFVVPMEAVDLTPSDTIATDWRLPDFSQAN